MYTYRVTLGASASLPTDVMIVRAKNCAQAEKKALAHANEAESNEPFHVVAIIELDGDFVD